MFLFMGLHLGPRTFLKHLISLKIEPCNPYDIKFKYNYHKLSEELNYERNT
jgi:hypothetical protein